MTAVRRHRGPDRAKHFVCEPVPRFGESDRFVIFPEDADGEEMAEQWIESDTTVREGEWR